MNLYIEQIRPALADEWDVIWRWCTYATYFHSREWAEIWSQYTQGKTQPNPLLVIFNDGKEALLPLSCIMSENSVWGFVSSPDGNYGGWISVDPIGQEHMTLMKEFLTKKIDSHLYWYINPFDNLITETSINAQKIDETYTIDLEKGFDKIYKSWSAACRRAERKARRSGVRTKIAETKKEWQEYYKVYENSFRRWGDQALGALRDWSLFQEMFDRHSDDIKLWLAMTKDGCIASGALMLTANKHIVNWHSAALEEYFPLRPVNLLFNEIIQYACDKGFRWFDFYPNAGLEGLRRFQNSFGAAPLDFSVVYVKPANKSKMQV